MNYLQEDTPIKEIDISNRSGRSKYKGRSKYPPKNCKGMLEMWKRRELQEVV
jgi:hypothetical protein